MLYKSIAMLLHFHCNASQQHLQSIAMEMQSIAMLFKSIAMLLESIAMLLESIAMEMQSIAMKIQNIAMKQEYCNGSVNMAVSAFHKYRPAVSTKRTAPGGQLSQ